VALTVSFSGRSRRSSKSGGRYRVRASDDIAALLAAAYGGGINAARLMPGLRLVAEALQEGNLARAGIAVGHLQLGALDDDRLERLARTDSLLKRNFDPNQPRVPAGNPDGGQWTGAGGGEGGTEAAGDSEAGSGASDEPGDSGGRVWERYPNAEFRNQLAIAENSAHKPNFGHEDVLDHGGNRYALGRYQMRFVGLQAAGMIDAAGNWTGKYGIYSRKQLLANPVAQEQALTDLLNDTERQLRINGSMRYVGSEIEGQRARFTITRAGLVAAAHREGAGATHAYLSTAASYGFVTRGRQLNRAGLSVETRLRTFADVPYE
jgi:hypothetical protein